MGEPIIDAISPWMPETDPHRLAVLGKMIEELNECASRAARCIIQGLDEIDPDTGRPNRIELEKEMADVLACFDQVEGRIEVYVGSNRRRDKGLGFDRWHRMIDEELEKIKCVAPFSP